MVSYFISAFILSIAVFYIWSDMLKEKMLWTSLRTWIFIFITTILIVVNYFSVNNLIKVVNMTLILIIIFKFFYKTDLKYSIAYPLMIQVIYLVSESLFAIFMFAILKNGVNDFVNNYIGSLTTNIAVTAIALAIYKIKFVKKIFYKFELLTSELDNISTIIFSIVIVFVYNIFVINTYYGLNPKLLMFISAFVSLISFVLVFMFFKAKDDYYKICDKYNSSILSLKEFEDVLNNYRVDNHENKNHLLAIRNMTKNKKVISFIDAILDNKEKDNSNLMHETSVIPSGGLRGLIYSKMLVMKNKDIEYELDVDRKVRTVELLDYGDDTLLDICKIIGIFLDNAIEEVENLDEKYIIIEMFIEDDILKISITNIFDTSVDKSDIYKVGYSTKGDKHGYGLSLVKKLTDKNRKLKTHHEINDDEFTQVLEILK